jgi:hypothetical protein
MSTTNLNATDETSGAVVVSRWLSGSLSLSLSRYSTSCGMLVSEYPDFCFELFLVALVQHALVQQTIALD